MNDRAVAGVTRTGRHAPGLRCRRDQQLARAGPDAPQRLPITAHRRAAAGRLPAGERIVEVGIHRRQRDLDLRPVGLELLGEQHRDRGQAALPELGGGHHQGDRVIRGKMNPGVGTEVLAAEPIAVAGRGETGQVKADEQPAAGGSGQFEKLATLEVRFRHDASCALDRLGPRPPLRWRRDDRRIVSAWGY